jgi:hypothetical protein
VLRNTRQFTSEPAGDVLLVEILERDSIREPIPSLVTVHDLNSVGSEQSVGFVRVLVTRCFCKKHLPLGAG